MKIPVIIPVIIALLVVSTLVAGCLTTDTRADNITRIKVLVTVLPQASYVQAIGGEKVEVFIAVPPGADPHTFEPSARDMARFSDADIFITLGKGMLPLEDNLVSRLASINPGMKVVETTPGITILYGDGVGGEEDHEAVNASYAVPQIHSHEGPDPHIWISLKNAPVMADHVYEALAVIDPDNRPYYLANRDSLLVNLSSAEKDVAGLLESSPGKKFITTHASWGYLARDYGLTQVVIGHPGKEATSKDIEDLIRLAREDNITLIVTEPQYSRKAAEVIAESVNGSIITVDPLAPDMPQEIRKLARAISGTVQN